jgi:kumamolisin
MPGFVLLPGSDRAEIPDAVPAGDIDPAQRIEVTLILRRRAELPAGTYGLSSDQLAETYGADPADIARVREELTGYGLTVTSAHQASRRMKITGSIAALSHAFGTTLSMVSSQHPGTDHRVRHRYRTGPLMIPEELAGIVTAVLGLDDRPAARAHFRRSASGSGTATFTAVQVAQAYAFPAGTDGSGQTIAIIELGGGFSTTDLATYFSGLGIDQPAVTAVSVDGAANSPGQSDDAEVMLDIEVAGAVAPRASQFVYFAPNTEQGFIDAVSDATHASPVPTAISISWGQSEDTWTAQSRDAMDAAFADAVALTVTVTAAAGDSGSGDGVADGRPHVDFPASSPHVLACGGTSLVVTGGVITSETVWNDTLSGGSGATGGGVSDVFAQPAWQSRAGVPPQGPSGTGGPWRGVPDVAGNADPATGYQVIVDGKSQVYGGTSAVAPLWAALIARLAQGASKRFGLLHPALYRGIAPGTDVPGFRDITSGSNGAYSATRGWDPCTGLGSPDGAALLTRLTR